MVDEKRVEGAADKAKGSVKDAVGKVTGDEKLQAEGKADKTEGKVKSTVGGIKDALKGE
ncbi:CsbD family protein [Terrihabitans sp. B22-R8]|uniref:CsbD family protein n=1 Tax=Terrihabitans sp. B22-R8 TaxID=3425128 RepID=UPI00403CEA2A